MRDLMPTDMARFRSVEAEFHGCCVGWGYEEIRTPVLEHLHLFTSAGTLSPDMLGRIYSFLDWDGWSGERVVLRPDGTIPAARLYVESLRHRAIARLFYIENMFAFESVGDESRERWQCGAELIGGHKAAGDVELISLALEAIGRMGVGPVHVTLAHAGLLRTFFEGLGICGEDEADLLDHVFAGNLGVLGGLAGGSPETQRKLQLLFGLKGDAPGFVENLRSVLCESQPALETSLDELARIAEMLTGLGCGYQIDFTSGRGFEYYTGVIFGFHCEGRRLGGGGRYDKLIHLVGGKDIPASGFALYLDDLMALTGEPPRRDRILVTGGDVANPRASFEVARPLRDGGYIVEFDIGYEDRSSFRWVIEMRSGEECELIDQASGERRPNVSPSDVLKLVEEAACS
jgi:histidyl-tRNA synthetase